MDSLLELLQKHKFRGSCRRLNIAKGEPTQKAKNGQSFLVTPVMSDCVTKGPIFDACQEQNPNFEFTHLAVNHNVTCTPHRDGRNRGESRILFLGDFKGGDLHFEDSITFNETGRWLSFDPQHLHWNSPVTEGDKYSIVAYKHASFAKKQAALAAQSQLPLDITHVLPDEANLGL